MPKKVTIPYTHNQKTHNLSAAIEMVPFIIENTSPTSLVDVGCGLGSWLKIFRENGILDLLGVDGDFVNKELLYVSESIFYAHDLTKPLYLNRRFDLALSLEVAEHLPKKSAEIFVDTLCKLSDTIIFSAAIPGQGGQNHINEQWPSYWQNLFLNRGYIFYDIFREKFWTNPNIEFWYKQNMFLVTKKPFDYQQKIPIYIYPCKPPLTFRCIFYSIFPCFKKKLLWLFRMINI